MMPRYLILGAVVIIAVVAVAFVPSFTLAAPQADVTLIAVEDTYVDAASPTVNWNNGLLFLNYGTQPGQVILLKFDLTSLTPPFNSAKLGMGIAKGCNLSPINITAGIDIYAIPDTWTESSVTWNTKPTRGAKLASSDATVYTSANNQATWTDNTAGDGLLQYIQDEKAGDGIASIWVELPAPFGGQIVFEDREKNGVGPGCTQASTIRPSLRVSDTTLPNSVTLRTMDSNDTSTRPWILAVAALLLGAVVALAVVRRRRTAN